MEPDTKALILDLRFMQKMEPYTDPNSFGYQVLDRAIDMIETLEDLLEDEKEHSDELCWIIAALEGRAY